MATLLILTLFWSGSPAFSLGQETVVLVRKPIVRLVRAAELRASCPNSRRIEACTVFVGERLFCNCFPFEGGWQIRAHAQFVPVMVLKNGQHVVHENEHIEDIRLDVLHLIDELSSERFESLSACRAAASSATARFPDTMNQFKISSNEKRHGRER